MNNPLNIYQFLNSAGVQGQTTDTPFNFLNTSPWHLFSQQQQHVVGSDSAASKLTMLNNALMSKANETSHKQRGLSDGMSKKSHVANFHNEEGEEEYLNEESEDADNVGVDVDDEDDDDEDVDDDDDDEEEEYDVDDHAFNPTAASQSTTRSKQSVKQAAHKANEASTGAGSCGGPAFKLEQNEKTIKKNKVIELYTKGERCVRKLSQLTGVPLTTVYRVIGKLKGINYNIPRGNGAGRKTILDAQDREILVEILNAQPRISRKALGKELEKRTGKSIHNSTLNRELCRLRHHGHNFAATVAAADLIANSNSGNNKNAAHLAANITLANSTNYMKHFVNNDTYGYKESSSNSSIELRSSTSNTKALQRYTAQMRSDSNETNEDEFTSDNDKLMRQVVHESKRFGNNLSQSEIECKSVANMPNELSKLIIEICQMSTTHLSSASSSLLLQARLDKIHTAVDFLLNDHFGKRKVDNKEARKSPYEIYLSEACVQLCQLKPTLLTRPDDLVNYATRILENCSIYEERDDKEALGGSLRNGKR
jgi:transposase